MIYRGIDLKVFVHWTHKDGDEFKKAYIWLHDTDITDLLSEETVCDIVRKFGEEGA
jgi:hypothetical protein